MSFNDSLLICIVCLNFGLAILVLVNDFKNWVNRIFALFVFSVIFWMISNFFANNFNDFSLLWNKLTFLAAILVVFFIQYFSIYFPFVNKTLTRKNHFILIAPVLLLSYVLLFTDSLISGVKRISIGVGVVQGELYSMWPIFFLLYISLALYNLSKKYFIANSKNKKQIGWVFSGLFFSIMFAFITNLFFPFVFKNDNLSNLGPYSTIIFVIFTFYTIIKHQLLNIKLIATELMVIFIDIIFILQVAFSHSITQTLSNIFLLLLVSYFGYILIKSVVLEIKRREDMEKLAGERERALKEIDLRNRNLLTLQRFSNIILDNDEMKPMIQGIIDVIPKEIPECVGAVVTLADEDAGKMRGYCISETDFKAEDLTKQWKKLIGYYNVSLKSEENLIMTAYNYLSIQRGNHLSDFVCPPFDKSVVHSLQVKSKIKGLIAVPLSAKDEKFGVIIFGLSHYVDDIDPDALIMMTAISNEVSLAVQRALAYEGLKTANEYLKEVDKMKDEFISVASHELNTPLAAIQGYLSMILEEGMGKVDKTAEEYLNRVYSSSKRLAALILDLLNVSRIEQGRIHLMYGQITPQDLIKSVIDELIVKSNMKKIYLKFEKPTEELPETWCDVNRIREVIINLVGNGIKFTDTGGITIAVRMVAKQFEFSVTDTGVGILQEDADKLFKKFSQLNREKNEFQGSGLGLFISKKLIELHGGKIWVECEEGKGTTFKFRLPYVKDRPEDPNEGEGAILTTPTPADDSEVEKEAKAVVKLGNAE